MAIFNFGFSLNIRQSQDWNKPKMSLGLSLDIETKPKKVSVSVSILRPLKKKSRSQSRDFQLSLADLCTPNYTFSLAHLYVFNFSLPPWWEVLYLFQFSLPPLQVVHNLLARLEKILYCTLRTYWDWKVGRCFTDLLREAFIIQNR